MDHQHTTTELHKKLVEKWLFLNRKIFTQRPTGEENLSDPLFSNTCITGTDIEHRYSWKIGEKIHLWYWIHLYFSVKTIVKQLIEGTHYLPSWSFPSMPSWTSLCCSEQKNQILSQQLIKYLHKRHKKASLHRFCKWPHEPSGGDEGLTTGQRISLLGGWMSLSEPGGGLCHQTAHLLQEKLHLYI